MRKPWIVIASIAACSIAVHTLTAQTKQSTTKTPATTKGTVKTVAKTPAKAVDNGEPKPKPNYKPVQVFLGSSDYSNGKMPKTAFDTLMKQGLTARDSAGNPVSIREFWFFYKERNLYEDSAGRYYIGVDLLSDFCKGNKLNDIINASIYERTKAGDTVLFDNIVAEMPDNTHVKGLPMELILTK